MPLLPKEEFDDLLDAGSLMGAALIIVAIVPVIGIVVATTPKAMAAPTFRATGDNGRPAALVLHNDACANAKVLAVIESKIKPTFQQGWRRAVLTWGGRDWESCWYVLGGVVYSFDEEGSQFQPVPRSAFRDGSV